MLNDQFWQQLNDYNTDIAGIFRNQEVAKPVIDFIKNGKTITDLGCGPGQLFPFLKKKQKVFAIDASPKLLAQAREVASKNNLKNISFIQADMAHYCLPDKADITLLSMSFFPDGLHHAIQTLTNVQNQTISGGNVMLLAPCMESKLYWFHLWYRWQFERGVPEEELLGKLRDGYNHILTYGYYHNPRGVAHGQLIKNWVKEELHDLLAGVRFKKIKIEKHTLPWKVYYPEKPFFHDHKPLWFWRATMINP